MNLYMQKKISFVFNFFRVKELLTLGPFRPTERHKPNERPRSPRPKELEEGRPECLDRLKQKKKRLLDHTEHVGELTTL